MVRSIIRRQTGAVLATTLLLLVVITLLGVAALRFSRLELRMAGNTEAKLQSFQTAQALADAVYATPAMVPVIGAPGFSICTPTLDGCNRNDISLPGFTQPIEDADLTGQVVQLAEGMVPRGLETSADKFGGVRYRVTSTYDRTDENLGTFEVVQGMLILVPR